MDIISAENDKHSIADAIILCNNNGLSTRLEYQIADLLHHGACKVFDKNKNEFVENIEMQEYNFHTWGGRNFLAYGEIFFIVQDWIS